MFEKEAEEYVIKKHHIDKTKLPIDFSLRCEFSDDFTDFQKGAEFGFQKGIKAKINTTTISDCPIKDEWHYVKDGIMPEENQWVLVYDGSYTVCNYHSNTPIKWLDNYENEVYEGNIVAWKEIVLPEGEVNGNVNSKM